MEIDSQRSITSLKRLLSEVDHHENLNIWIDNAESILRRIYPNRTFDLSSKLSFFFSGDSRPTHEKELKQLIGGYIKELEELGHPQIQNKAIGQQININQTLNLNIVIEALKEELSGKQVTELKESYNKGKTPEEKRSNVAEKLKKFGADLTSNILANIITNPSIFTGL